ncbi:MAG: DUF922 domain-containing protein [Rhizobiaceae bacterium]|nr:MAG: DUF922 domain-containing protein [Rhizobiaceae bacterium]CAG0993670.1 hypothetical protein RHIZO_02390 [Rhizobiaceae bacterium]
MHCLIIACIAGAACAVASSAAAGVKVGVKTEHYEISGKSGEALVTAMDRKGPKHGFLARAIAQTRYEVGWDLEWTEKAGKCRVRKVAGDLSITYIYPKVSGPIDPALGKRWARFMSGVRKHEETHGAIARQMVSAAEKAIAKISTTGDPGCVRVRSEVKRRVNAVYAEYEKKQIRFDEVEHKDGGNVEKLVVSLLKKR